MKRSEIFPDMQGVQATFKIADMFKTENSREFIRWKPKQQVPLTILTQNGSETIALSLKGSRTKGGVSGGDVACLDYPKR